MQVAQTYQSNRALELLRERMILGQIESALNRPGIRLERGITPVLKEEIEDELESHGWARRMRIDVDFHAHINAFHTSGVALQVQMGNVARAFYDLMKLQRLREIQKADVGVLVVPMRVSALKIGSNLASFERLSEEHEMMFREQISIPLVIFGIS
jgi:hypothetical protein